MRKNRIGIFLSLLLLIGFTSCTEQKSNSKLVINEVLVDNQTNFQDDYGVHSGWIEIFNKAYSTSSLKFRWKLPRLGSLSAQKSRC